MRKPARPAPARDPLSRDRIAAAALALIDEEGLESCSMRRLGARLGVEAMALYHHFADKGELMDAVMDLLLDDIALPPRESAPPLERLRRAVAGWRGVAMRHPRAYALLAGRRFNTDRAFLFYEQILQAFADLGLDARDAARWFRLLGGYASGAGMAEVASREAVTDATALRLEHQPDAIAYPHVRAVAPHLRVQALDDVFEHGLDVLFASLAARVGRPMPAPGRARSRPSQARR